VETTTVTASADSVDIKQSSGTNTISESEIRNMPNRDERFTSLLPLIPGVVRGSDGQIDMKGAQASQNGSLRGFDGDSLARPEHPRSTPSSNHT